MKILKLVFLSCLLIFISCSKDDFNEVQSSNIGDNLLKSRSVESVEDFVYPNYHVVYDPTTDMLNITLDPQDTDYDPGVFTHIVFYMDVETPSGYSRRYGGAFPMKGRCWADMYYAFIGEYEVRLEINGIVFNTTRFSIPTPINNHTRTGNITFQSATFGN